MAYSRKTKDVYTVEGLYSRRIGWELLTQEDEYKDAKLRLKEYNENERNYPHRIKKCRVPNE